MQYFVVHIGNVKREILTGYFKSRSHCRLNVGRKLECVFIYTISLCFQTWDYDVNWATLCKIPSLTSIFICSVTITGIPLQTLAIIPQLVVPLHLSKCSLILPCLILSYIHSIVSIFIWHHGLFIYLTGALNFMQQDFRNICFRNMFEFDNGYNSNWCQETLLLHDPGRVKQVYSGWDEKIVNTSIEYFLNW